MGDSLNIGGAATVPREDEPMAKITPAQQTALIALAQDPDGWGCNPHWGYKGAGGDASRWFRTMAALLRAGLVTDLKPDGSKYSSGCYRLTVDGWTAVGAATVPS